MKRRVLVAILVLQAAMSGPALAWDPDSDWPEVEPPTPEVRGSEPTPVEPPEGIYLVTDTYAGDSVTRSGPVTTYTTETVHEITGSYARVLETVGTAAASVYDGSAFNGRAALTDGRPVAGTYYENYIRTDYGFVPVSVVFFQDDAEIARASGGSPPSRSAPAPAASTQPVASAPPVGAEPAAAAAPASPATGSVTPTVDREDRASPPAPAPERASALLADRALEVLRGRRIAVPFAGGDVRAWRYVSGEAIPLGALSGSGSDAFVARWDRLAPPGGAWAVRFAVDYADGTTHELLLRVTVRSPGLVE